MRLRFLSIESRSGALIDIKRGGHQP